MFNKKKIDEPSLKMKEFSLTDEELSELSFVKQQERAFQEITVYWGKRFESRLATIKTRLGLGPDDHFDFRDLWTKGKLLSFHFPKPKVNPEESAPVPNKNAEQKLPKK